MIDLFFCFFALAKATPGPAPNPTPASLSCLPSALGWRSCWQEDVWQGLKSQWLHACHQGPLEHRAGNTQDFSVERSISGNKKAGNTKDFFVESQAFWERHLPVDGR